MAILQTISGIDELSAALLIAEIGGDVKSFKNKKSFCSWMGVNSDWMERDYFFQSPEISHRCGFQGIRKENTSC